MKIVSLWSGKSNGKVRDFFSIQIGDSTVIDAVNDRNVFFSLFFQRLLQNRVVQEMWTWSICPSPLAAQAGRANIVPSLTNTGMRTVTCADCLKTKPLSFRALHIYCTL